MEFMLIKINRNNTVDENALRGRAQVTLRAVPRTGVTFEKIKSGYFFRLMAIFFVGYVR